MTQRLPEPPAGALAVLECIRGAGHEAYFCGGCVRDALLGAAPKDWDITTSATPEIIEALFPDTVPVGKAFGVMVVVHGGVNYEVAAFRADLPYRDGRRPEGVRFTGAEEDVKRRDFTVNALLYDPETRRVLDYVGGVEDLRRGVLRTVGDPEQRFMEDHLRLLRAVRFAARTGFALDLATLAAMRGMAGLVKTVSGERIGSEITRMLTEGSARRAFGLLEESGLLPHALPEVALLRGVPQPKKFHPEGDVLDHTLLMLAILDECVRGRFPGDAAIAGAKVEMDADDEARGMEDGAFAPEEAAAAAGQAWERIRGQSLETLAYAALLHDVGKPGTIFVDGRIRFNDHDVLGAELASAALERLKRPRAVSEAVHGLVRRHIHFASLRKMKKSKLRRWLQEPEFPLHLELHRLDCASSHRKLANYEFGYRAWLEELSLPPKLAPLLTGRDLLALGYAAGPEMGEILRAVEDAALEGELADREAALAFVRARYPR